MGKKSIWRRVLAVVLALSMVCSVQTMSVYADIFGLETRPVQQTADQPEQNETEPTVTPTPTPEAEATPTPIPESDTESENEEDGSRVVYTNHISTVKDAVKFRSAMNTADDSNIIAVLQAETVVKVLMKETVGDMAWYQIKAEVTTVDTATGESTAQTQTGYVSADFLNEPQMVQTEDSTEEKDPEVTGDNDQESEETEETGDPAVTEINKSGITTGEVHLRSEASKESESLGILAVNTEVFVLTEIQTETEDTWYNVNVPSSEEEGTQKTGYVSGDYLQITDETTSDETEGEGESDVEETPFNGTGTVLEDTELKDKPAADGQVIVSVAQGTEVEILTQANEYYKVSVPAAAARSADPEVSVLSDGMETGYLPADKIEVKNDESNGGASATTEAIREYADKYFNSGSKDYLKDQIGVSLDYKNSGEVYAGDQLTYTVTYNTDPAPIYDYAAGPQPLFDQYNDVTITVQLPEGLTITEAMQKEILSGYSNVGSIAGPAEGNVWTFSLKNSIAAQDSDMGSFTFNAFVEGNGAVEVGREYSYDDLKISISTNFDVLNKVDVTPEVVANYPMTASTDLSGSVEAATQDEWTIQKTTRGTGYTVSEDGKTVTVQFQLAVGLKDSNGNITTQGEAYNRNGRAPFEGNILIKDTLSDVLANDRSTIQPISATLTPQFGEKTPISIGGTDTATDGTEETFNDGSTDIQTALQSLSLPYQTCGKADISDVDKNAPYYSVYYLDITYPYKQFVANYYDADKDAIEIENSAELEYQFKGEETPRAAGPSEASVEIKKETEPAAITISKTIRDREGKETLYSNTTTDWGKVSGSAVFTVKHAGSEEKVSDVKLYTRSGDAESGYIYTVVSNNGTIIIDPQKTSEGTTEGTSISYVTANGTTETLYLDPGNYIITESGRPSKTEFYGIKVGNASTVQADDIENNEYFLSAGETKTLNFINKETLGAVEVTKTGENGAKLSGAEFILYGSKTLTDPETPETTEIDYDNEIANDTTDTDGTILFDDLDYGTYWLVETQAPEGYVADSIPIKVVVSEENENSLTKVIVENQVNGAQIKLQKRYFNHATGKLEECKYTYSNIPKGF